MSNILALQITLIVLLIFMLLALLKLVIKGSIFYKLQSINTFNSLSILFLIVYIFYTKNGKYIDLALVYIIINYIGIIAIMKYVTINYKKNDNRNK